jgi:diguanylate cyclase (GGDEF)-like protein
MDGAPALAPASALDLARCADEPIHRPGTIQPHGALLAIAPATLQITHVSANFAALSGIPAALALGQSLDRLIGAAACEKLMRATAGDFEAVATGLSQELTLPDGRACYAQTHSHDNCRIIEFEPAATPSYDAVLGGAQTVISRLRQLRSLEQVCDSVTREVQSLTGYDRVMIYRFDQDGHGDVIAESRRPELEPYLHLRYPASDVPAQARRLYMMQRLRVIPSVDHVPVPILTAGRPLDMSYCSLRSVSPVHLEYLRNMDVAATMTISIIHDHRLWGMVVCHHRAALSPSPGLRALCELFGQLIGLLIGETEERERLAAQLRAQARLAQLAQRFETTTSLFESVAGATDTLMGLVNATGAFLRLNGRSERFGAAPPEPVAGAILDAMRTGQGDEVQATDNLAKRHPAFQDLTERASGVLMVPIAAARGDGLLLFRPETIHTVQWGGDPEAKAVLDPQDGRIRPRRSFAAWAQMVRGTSAAWSRTDLMTAFEFRRIITRGLLRQSEAELVRLSNTDPLTGLPNRRMLGARLAEWRAAPQRRSACLLFLDLDRFKTVNDSLGHHAGDELLQEVARRLAVLAQDEWLLVRLGGDEFVLFREGVDGAAAAAVARRVLALFDQPFSVAGRPHRGSTSIGVAVSQAAESDLLREADAALHAAKRPGGDRIVYFDPALHRQALNKLQVEQDLFVALERNQFVLHFQPVVRLPDREVTGFEALVRLQHPERGLIMPGGFIGVAEETGLIGRIGHWVAEATLRAAVSMRETALRFGFNVSGHQLLTGDFAGDFTGMLRAHDMPADRMTIEVTESTLMDESAIRQLERLRELGCRVAIDDFGTGYSSIANLRRLPVDSVKLDRSFIVNSESDPQSEAVFRAVIDLAHTLNLQVTAEGVETEAQCALVTRFGSDRAQGYLFGRPQPLAKFAFRGPDC